MVILPPGPHSSLLGCRYITSRSSRSGADVCRNLEEFCFPDLADLSVRATATLSSDALCCVLRCWRWWSGKRAVWVSVRVPACAFGATDMRAPVTDHACAAGDSMARRNLPLFVNRCRRQKTFRILSSVPADDARLRPTSFPARTLCSQVRHFQPLIA